MLTVMGALTVVMLTSAVALSAASGDFGLGSDDKEAKQAYAAAEAGVNLYLFHLKQDNAYWAKCTGTAQNPLPEPNAVNQRWNGNGSDPRKWRSVPQPKGDPRTDKAQYSIELLPANGRPACDPNDAQDSMIDGTTGTFRIRSTGRVRRADGTYEKRSVIAQFRRSGFLDFLYFTDFETSDPAWYALSAQGRATSGPANPKPQPPSIVDWASQFCSRWWRQGRGDQRYWDPNDNNVQDGYWFTGSSWQQMPWVDCTAIQFADGDRIRGPFHTNDDIYVCGDPDFGRNSNDKIEVSAPSPGWRSACGGSDPDFIGEWKPNSPVIGMPPSNAKLKSIAAEGGYVFTGKTEITLNGNVMNVTNAAMGLNNSQRPFPSNGVIFVQNGDCGQGYNPLALNGWTDTPAGCGDVRLRGSYSTDLTIATENDILISGDVRKSADNMLGLIANNLVRVYHPVSNLNAATPSCSNASGTMDDVRIDAAILALQHSFTVDHYFCGNPLDTLTVFGAIAQKYRGPVGRGGSGGVSNGYLKDYQYDDRLRLRQPPHFLDPVQSRWRMVRQWEQSPAR
jgi:hypothetical protein